MVHVMLNFAGADQRQDDLFGNENFFSKGKSALKGLKVSEVLPDPMVPSTDSVSCSLGCRERLYAAHAAPRRDD